MDLSIVIVNWNTCDLITQCVQSLGDTIDGLVYEIIVVDNASMDGSVVTIRDNFPEVHLIANSENVGFARANNQAISFSQGRYVLLLNSDTLVRDGAIFNMVSFMDQHRDVGVLGPALLDADGDVSPSWAKFPTLRSELFERHVRKKEPFFTNLGAEEFVGAYEVDWVAGACLMVCREAIEQVGLMDERFFLYSEETDWCLRIKSTGWRIVYYPKAQVVHFEGKSSAKDRPKTLFLLNWSKILYARKHFGEGKAFVLRVGLIFRALSKALLRLVQARPVDAQAQWALARRLWSI